MKSKINLMNLFKKMISVTCSTTLVLGLSVPAFANSNDTSSIVTYEANRSSILKDIANEEKFFACFNIDADAPTSMQTTTATNAVLSADYSYTLTLDNPESIEPYYAEMNIQFNIGDNVYSTIVTGRAGELSLDDGRTYITGSLKGTIQVGTRDYSITVGLNKIKQSDGMSGCVTMIPVGTNDINSMIAFRFGDDVMNSEILAMLLENSDVKESQSQDRASAPYRINGGKLVGTAYASLSGYSSRGITEVIYANSSEDRLYANVTSYCDNMKNTDIYAYMVSVHEVDYYLSRNSGVAIATIFDATDNGMTEGDMLPTEMFLDVIEMCLTATGQEFAATFLNTMRIATAQYYTPTCNSNRAVVRITFGTGKHAVRFDDTPCSMAVNMAGNGTGSYTMSAEIEYYILNDGGFYYASSNRANSTFSATF